LPHQPVVRWIEAQGECRRAVRDEVDPEQLIREKRQDDDVTVQLLVVRRSVRVRRIVVGLDGSRTPKGVLGFVAGLVPPANGRAVLVTAVNTMRMPSHGLVPGAADIAREVKRTNATRRKTATRELNRLPPSPLPAVSFHRSPAAGVAG
jgi:hypothetical protein